MTEVKDDVLGDLAREHLAVLFELGLHGGHLVHHALHLVRHLVLVGLQDLVLLSLALARVVGGEAVALDALDAPLLLLVLGLGSLARGQARLGLGEHLAPRLALLHRPAALGGRRSRCGGRL